MAKQSREELLNNTIDAYKESTGQHPGVDDLNNIANLVVDYKENEDSEGK